MTTTTTTTSPSPPSPGQLHELTVVERAAVLRACRDKRADLRISRDRLQENSRNYGDKHADAASRVLDAELSILEAAIRTLWKQSGVDPPPDDTP